MIIDVYGVRINFWSPDVGDGVEVCGWVVEWEGFYISCDGAC